MREHRECATGFGVGGYISKADPIDFALDIVEVEGKPTAKRRKLSGKRSVYRTRDGGHHVGVADREGPTDGEELLQPLPRDGEIVREFDLDETSERVAEVVERVAFGINGYYCVSWCHGAHYAVRSFLFPLTKSLLPVR